jgi:hypothetical protein
MPNPILTQQCSWPGVNAVASCTYTAGWGLSPGTAILVTYPQPINQFIAPFGTLVIGDGQRAVTLQNCRVSRITGEMGPDGQTWTIEIQDRRWTWLGLGQASIDANVLDMRSKLVPWSIYSPQEIATICLDAMGEVNYDISDLPTGLVHADGADVDRYLLAGENFAQSLCNPHVTFDHAPPMECLARLADTFGCVVMLQHSTNTVRVVKIGHGLAQLPNYPSEAIAPGVTLPRIPASVNVAGAPIRYQLRFVLEPVGEEWNGAFVPISELSYAPLIPSNVYHELFPKLQVQPDNKCWALSPPPYFYGVQATNRLSLAEAYQKAQKYVWKAFRIRNINVATGQSPISIPNYDGQIVRRQQIVLQRSKVVQVQPQPRVQGAGNLNPVTGKLAPLFGAFPPYYDGYSRDVPAEVFTDAGVIIEAGGQVMWNTGQANTPVGSKVFVDFDVNTFEQTVIFVDYVWNRAVNTALSTSMVVADPLLVLETACLVKDPDLGNLIRYEQSLQLGGNAPPQWESHDDVGIGVIALYQDSQGGGPQNTYLGWKYGDGDLADATGRSNYYLQGMAAKIQIPQGQHNAYIGIYPIDLDGCVQQVSYSVDGHGPSSHIGLNTEFSVSIPNYPQRRRAENLPPNASAVDANMREAALARIPTLDPNFGIK